MTQRHGLNIYLATTHNLLDTIPVEEGGDLSIAELKMKLSERHPTMCSTRTQLLHRYNVLQDEERISDYPEIMEEGVLCVESPARAPTRTEGLMLHHALADRDKELVLQMLREGIHPGPLISSDDGNTHNLLQAALVGDFTYEGQAATDNPYPQLTKILIEARAEVNLIDDSGITPLILATTMEYPAGIHMLLSHRADPNRTDQLYEEAPLHYAIQHNSEECVQLLLEGRANPLLCSETSEQLTPRCLALKLPAMETGFPVRQRQNPDWLMEVDYIACNDVVHPDHLDREEIVVGGNPVTVFHLPLTQSGQKASIHILYSPNMTQGANASPPAGWAELLCFPEELNKTVLCGQNLIRITEGQHHLVHETGIVVYGANKRLRCKLARLLNGETWFKARRKITSFEHMHTTTPFEAIPFLSCGDLGYLEGPKALDSLAELATQKRVILPTGDFSSPYIWAAKVMFDALMAVQQSIQKAELLLNAIEPPENIAQRATLRDIKMNLEKSRTGVAFLLWQFTHIAQRGSCEVMLDV
eukprot:s1436_g21.t1